MAPVDVIRGAVNKPVNVAPLDAIEIIGAVDVPLI